MSGRPRHSVPVLLLVLVAGLLTAAPPEAAQAQNAVMINEIRIDQPGTDNDEYVELAAPPGTSLDGLTYLVIGDGTGGSGVVEAVIDLSGQTVGSTGFFLVAESTFTLGTAQLTATLNFENGDNITHLLVGGFTGANGQDLDTNDDGALDVTPWSAEYDRIALIVEDNPPTSTEYHYGPPTVGPDGSFVPGHVYRCPDASGTWLIGPFDPVGGDDTPGAANACGEEPPPGTMVLKVHEVQGSGSTTPLAGQAVTVEAVVTSTFTSSDVLDGFFVQEEDADSDADPGTSEGIFVFCRGNCPATLAEGDLVEVTGTATEFFGMTQIDATTGATTTVGTGAALPAAIAVDLPAAGSTQAAATFEHLEGMVVTFPDTLVVSEYFQLARFGQVVLTADARPYQFTHSQLPSVDGHAAFLADLATRRIILDDDNNENNDAIFGGPDEPYPYPEPGLSITNRFRGGDTVTGLTGVLHWSFAGSSGTDAWRVRPIDSATYGFQAANPQPAAPGAVGGRVRVAGFNVLNYFTTIDQTSSNSSGACGPSGTLDCRGADSESERQRQLAKIDATIEALDADVVGLVELENDGDDASIASIVAALNVDGGPHWSYVPTGSLGTDAIKVGLIYSDAVTLVGASAVLDTPAFVDPNNTGENRNRPALAASFAEAATGEVFTVVVNHLKSKGSSGLDCSIPSSNLDCDQGDGQAFWNDTRTDAALALVNWLAGDPTGAGDPDVLLVGDLNAYRNEDPIRALENAGYVDLAETFIGDGAYSFLFDGQLGYLDYVMANASLASQVTGAIQWHTNADEVPLFDYNDELRDLGEASFERESAALPLYEPDAFRASDHDPVLVGLELASTPLVAEMTADVEIKLEPGPNDDEFTVEGTFTPASSIDPLSEEVRIQVATLSRTIPPGSFELHPDGHFRFEDENIEVVITPLADGSYSYDIKGENAELSGAENPIEVVLTIGDDTGTATDEEAEIEDG